MTVVLLILKIIGIILAALLVNRSTVEFFLCYFVRSVIGFGEATMRSRIFRFGLPG